MKFVTFQVGKTVSYGAVSGDGIIDLGKRLGKKYPTLRSALKAGKLNELKTVAKSARKTDVALEFDSTSEGGTSFKEFTLSLADHEEEPHP